MTMTADALKVYSSRLVVGDDGEVVAQTAAPSDTDPGRALDRLARDYCDAHPHLAYEEGLARVMANPANRALVAEYASPSYQPTPIPLPEHSPVPKRHGEDVDRAVRRYMADHGVEDYATAMGEVLQADPAMAKRYGEIADV